MISAPLPPIEAQASAGSLPERAMVHWRRTADEQRLRRVGWWWTLTAATHTVPFIAAAGLLLVLAPVTAPIAVVLLIHAWAIPELYAARGRNVLRRRRPAPGPCEQRALLLLGDLVDDGSRRLHARTGLILERGHLGTWVLGEAGALLVRPGGRRVNCYCVRVVEDDLPGPDRIAHLVLALRCDEAGFATVANLAFSGACWRVRRRLPRDQRAALDSARELSRRPSA